MDAGQALILQGDALHLPLPDESVDLIVTSPPYFALRAYDAGPAQVGSEPTPAAYLEALWAATAEMVRVLKPTGSMFVDLGDKYSGNEKGTPWTERALPNDRTIGGAGYGNQNVGQSRPQYRSGMPPKSLMLLPERYRIGCVDQLGLIARAVIVWDKPNGLPESVRDRVRRSHEDWVHLTRQPRYYSAIDEVREIHSGEADQRRRLYGQNDRGTATSVQAVRHDGGENGVMGFAANPLGKLPGSVWTIPSEPLRLPEHLGVDHYAAFPSEWPRRLILGWSPPGICLECGHGRWPVVDTQRPVEQTDRIRKLAAGQVDRATMNGGTQSTTMGVPADEISRTILGYACACTPYTEYHLDRWTPPPTRPAVVLDPFGGTGTVAMVARALGRVGLSFDLSMPYARAARWRIHHDAGKAISRTNLERQGSLL